MKRDEVRSRLDQLGVKPSRRLGQNFLLDELAAESLVGELAPERAGTVIEVGPGLGVLTGYLAERSRRLILLEKDTRLAAGLRERFAGQNHVAVVEGDALDYDHRPLFAHGPVRFIGNLPYSCGGAIIRRFLTPPTPVERAVVTLQKEVVDRLGAEPRTKAYGVLTLRIQAYWETAVLRTLPPDVFYPRPGIDSASLLLTPRPAEQLQPFDARGFDRLIRQGFSQRRKQLKKLLSVVGRDWESSSAKFGWSPTARAEELSLEDWVRLTRDVDDHPLKDIPQKDDEVFDVVNEEDEVVRQATRKEVHANDLLHRAVHLFVFNKHGELFLQKRSRLKDTHPGAWDSSAAGHLDAGEGYEAS
ncbi:MAG: 16S rRNA (adenine(1518)-N(6)/adenine(1519)-N(6))-dimethyltransferase RsmA, partial [Verrucomicrobiota bacterium]